MRTVRPLCVLQAATLSILLKDMGVRLMPQLRAAGWVVTEAGSLLVGQQEQELVSVAPDGTVARAPLADRLYEVVGAHAGGLDVTVRDDEGCAWQTLEVGTLASTQAERLPSL